MSPQAPASVATAEPGPCHAHSLREARARQLALIAIAAGNAAARLPAAVPPVAVTQAAAKEAEPLSEERRRVLAQIRRLGICQPVDPSAPAMDIGRAVETAP